MRIRITALTLILCSFALARAQNVPAPAAQPQKPGIIGPGPDAPRDRPNQPRPGEPRRPDDRRPGEPRPGEPRQPGEPRRPGDSRPGDQRQPGDDRQPNDHDQESEGFDQGYISGSYGYRPTFEEGIQRGYAETQRGYADVVRSYGMSNLMNSEAAKNYEQARRDALENRLRATQTYFDMRSYNRSYRASERGVPLSMDQYVRLARQMAPEQLSVSQLDPFTGAVNWPLALRRPEYSEHRERIERLYQRQAQGTSLVYGDIAKAVEDFIAVLMADLDKFKQPEYIQAKNFLSSLAYESQRLQR